MGWKVREGVRRLWWAFTRIEILGWRKEEDLKETQHEIHPSVADAWKRCERRWMDMTWL